MDDSLRQQGDKLRTHAALFDDMGQALGLDLQEEAIAGRLNFDEIGEAVLRCTRCAHPENAKACCRPQASRVCWQRRRIIVVTGTCSAI